ncbi:MAG TPA: hypothetical protein VFE25_10590 [Opitutaceae bacterium]|jgi:hypothetical protein|nr:hypothetical protein [Opitutaceae bacterium]
MSISPADENAGRTRNEMLSDEEECALSRLRDIVSRIRGSGIAVGVSSMEEGIRAAGGARVHSEEPDGPPTFVLKSARFTLRPSSANPGKIEVNFIPIT